MRRSRLLAIVGIAAAMGGCGKKVVRPPAAPAFLLLTVEGHCDERGTVEYNLALGERRARAAHDYLVSLGVPASRLKSVSYGKEAPLCRDSNEDCWARNRRAHFTMTGKSGGR